MLASALVAVCWTTTFAAIKSLNWSNGAGTNDWFDTGNRAEGEVPRQEILVGGSGEYIALIDTSTQLFLGDGNS